MHAPRSGCRWQDLAATAHPSGSTRWRRHRYWTRAGAWRAVWRLVLGELAAAGEVGASELILDGTFVGAKKGASAPASGGAGRG